MKSMVITGATALCLTAGVAFAGNVSFSPDLSEWEELTFEKLEPNRWHVENGSLVIKSDDSASMLYTSVSVAPAHSIILHWRWRVDEAPPATDLSLKGSDDRPLAVTVGFAYDSAQATLGERMKRLVVEQVAGSDAPGRVLELTWGGTSPAQSIVQSPHYGFSGRIVTLRGSDAPIGEWVEESIDVAALYRQIWGSEPPPVTQISVLADSDDTHSRARARIGDLRVERRPILQK